jgi:hypothetical protein
MDSQQTIGVVVLRMLRRSAKRGRARRTANDGIAVAILQQPALACHEKMSLSRDRKVLSMANLRDRVERHTQMKCAIDFLARAGLG